MLLWWIGLSIANILAVEFIQWTKGGFTQKIFKKGFAPDVNDEKFEQQQKNSTKADVSSSLKLVNLKSGTYMKYFMLTFFLKKRKEEYLCGITLITLFQLQREPVSY